MPSNRQSSCSVFFVSLFLQVCLFLFLTGHVHPHPTFLSGRPWTKHGLIGRPKRTERFLVGVTGPEEEEGRHGKEILERWFSQRLDHFDPTDIRIWKQRFFISDRFYKKGGPVLIQLGGEGEADPVWLKEGQVATNYARQFNALLILIEHRFYGKSHPTEDLSVSNLKYLTSQQALADFANFISHFQSSHPNLASVPWVSFGGSYSGSLSAWMRLKYPHLIHAAVASSAPLFAVINFKEYMAVVRDSLGSSCDDRIQAATEAIKDLIQESMTGPKTLYRLFKLCDPLDADNPDDVSNFMQSLASNFQGVVQYNKDNRDFEGAKATNITIDVVCSIMTNESLGEEIQRYAQVNKILLDAYDKNCLDYKYSNLIGTLRETSWNSTAASGARQWTYQTCTEFGFFQSSDLTNQPFGYDFPVSFFEKMCTDVYGEKFTHDLLVVGVNRTNTMFGGFNMKSRRIVFPNGSIDPWHVLGITSGKGISSDSRALLINGTAHCSDLYPDSDRDPPSLIEARIQIRDFLTSSLDQRD